MSIRDKQLEVRVLGEAPKFIEAPEPTNVIWENRAISNTERLIRGILSYILMFIILAMSFILLIYLKNKGAARNAKYEQIDCNTVFSAYSSDFINDRAIAGYKDYYRPSDNELELKKVPAILNCFCTASFA